jgi:hypothetical protein
MTTLQSRAREIALEVFREQAKQTLNMGDPIKPIEQALLEFREETIMQCAAIVSQAGREGSGWIRGEILSLLKEGKP